MSKITLRRKTYIQHTPVTFLPVANDDDSHLEDLHKARNGNSIIGFFRCVSYPPVLCSLTFTRNPRSEPDIGQIERKPSTCAELEIFSTLSKGGVVLALKKSFYFFP